MTRHILAGIALFFMYVGTPVHAAFHFMQIEEVIGGIDGNASAQAIQLRMRTGGQSVVSATKLWASDATGLNRVLLLDIASNVTNGAQGDRVLLATSSFTSLMNSTGGPLFVPDFALAAAIPASYLSAGRITFEDDAGSAATPGTIYWSLAWGGTGYTGSHAGNTTNDSDGNFGPAFSGVLPSSTMQGLLFTGASGAASTSNSTQYALSAQPAVVTRNDRTAFIVVPEPGSFGVLGAGGVTMCLLMWARRRRG